MTSLRILKAFLPMIHHYDDQTNDVIGFKCPIPSFTFDMIEDLIKETTSHLEKKPTLIRTTGPCYMVGDLHGNIFDLVRILSMAKLPPKSRYVFLGDYVDRGQFSFEILLLIFALFCQFPNDVILLRGNHEFADVNSTYGFFEELTPIPNGQYLYEQFNKVFEMLPIVAIVDDAIFCVHGGISPNLTEVSQIEKITRPIKSCDDELVADMMWSDPSTETKTYARSTRGLGISYGIQLVSDFLQKANLHKIIRGHQCVQFGVQKELDGLVYTVFSCSNYADAVNNKCGLLFLNTDLTLSCFSLPPKPQIERSKVNFIEINRKTVFEDEPNRLPFSLCSKIVDMRDAAITIPRVPRFRSHSQVVSRINQQSKKLLLRSNTPEKEDILH